MNHDTTPLTFNDPYNQPKTHSYRVKEIAFLTEVFREDKYDRLAYKIATYIHNFLKAQGKVDDIKNFLEELEAYSTDSRSENFIWELVYIRRYIKNKYSNPEIAIRHGTIAANHFGTICKINPSVYNRCCRILELLSLVPFLNRLKSNEARKRHSELLENAETFFNDIKVKNPAPTIYLRTAYFLYSFKTDYLVLTNAPAEVQLCELSKFAIHARNYYMQSKEVFVLIKLAETYIELCKIPDFPYESERENIFFLLKELNKEPNNKSYDARSALRRLRAAVTKYTADDDD